MVHLAATIFVGLVALSAVGVVLSLAFAMIARARDGLYQPKAPHPAQQAAAERASRNYAKATADLAAERAARDARKEARRNH